ANVDMSPSSAPTTPSLTDDRRSIRLGSFSSSAAWARPVRVRSDAAPPAAGLAPAAIDAAATSAPPRDAPSAGAAAPGEAAAETGPANSSAMDARSPSLGAGPAEPDVTPVDGNAWGAVAAAGPRSSWN